MAGIKLDWTLVGQGLPQSNLPAGGNSPLGDSNPCFRRERDAEASSKII